jgi:predicted Zn-dependent peptidase
LKRYHHMLKPIILKNGLTILKLPKNNCNLFTVGFVATTGSSIEAENFPQGISYLTERLFWCGTDKHPSKKALNMTLESMGGTYYSVTGHELTQYYISVPSYHQHKAVSMMSEIIQRSYFEPRDMEREKHGIIDELKSKEDFEYEASDLALSNIYQNTGLGAPMSGNIESVMSIKSTDVAEYLARQYQPGRSYLILAGNFDNKSITELVEQEWLYWNPKLRPYLAPLEIKKDDLPELPSIVYKQRGLPQTRLVVGFLLDGGMSPELPAESNESEEQTEEAQLDAKEVLDDMLTRWSYLLVLNTILGQGMSSRLWSKCVEEEEFFNVIRSDLIRFTSTSYLQIAGQTFNSQFTFALESIFTCLESLRKTTVSINELAKAKEYLKGRLVFDHEDLLSSTVWQVTNLIGSGLTFELTDLLE